MLITPAWLDNESTEEAHPKGHHFWSQKNHSTVKNEGKKEPGGASKVTSTGRWDQKGSCFREHWQIHDIINYPQSAITESEAVLCFFLSYLLIKRQWTSGKPWKLVIKCVELDWDNNVLNGAANMKQVGLYSWATMEKSKLRCCTAFFSWRLSFGWYYFFILIQMNVIRSHRLACCRPREPRCC